MIYRCQRFWGALPVLLCALTAPALAAPWIDMGPKDEFAFDQPAVSVELFNQSPNGTKGSSLGPNGGGFLFDTNQFILDTGASSTIAMNDAEAELRSNGYATVNTVLEQGVSGFEEIDVSAEYFLEVSGSSAPVLQLPSTHIMSGQFPDLVGINGIVGMPAMQGRVVTLDTSVWANVSSILDLVPMDVHFASTLPASGGHRYSVPLVAREFNVVGEGVLPTAAPIASLQMSVGVGNLNATGSFLLDTGAAISFISTNLGKSIGLDTNGDGQLAEGDELFDSRVPVGGIGGTSEVPLFYIDRFVLHTEQGVDLVWNLEQSLSVAIVDIDESIDGVLGADLMTSGWFSLLGEGDSLPGPLQQLHFDFRQFQQEGDPGKLYLDLSPEFDVVQAGTSSGDFNGDGVVDARDYVVWRNSNLGPTEFAAWRSQFGTTPNAGDLNNDGVVDAQDYITWRNNNLGSAELEAWRSHFSTTYASGTSLGGNNSVPEPTTALFLLAAFECVFFRRWGR